jgi:hypothetical protein
MSLPVKNEYVFIDVLGKAMYALKLLEDTTSKDGEVVYLYSEAYKVQIVPLPSGEFRTVMVPMHETAGAKNGALVLSASESFLTSVIAKDSVFYKELTKEPAVSDANIVEHASSVAQA